MKQLNLSRHARRVRDLRPRLAADDGIVLLWALIVMSVLMITTAAASQLVTSNEFSFGKDTRSTSALNLAEAGLSAAAGAVKATSTTTTSLSNNGTLGRGRWLYVATRTQDSVTDPTLYTWTVTATGVLGDETHIVRETLAQSIVPTSTSTTTTTPASSVYGYGMFLGAAASDCTTGAANPNQFSGSGIGTVSIYTAGSLCFNGSSSVQEPSTSAGNTVTMYVGGKLASSNRSVFAGTTAKYLKQVTAVGGCYDQNHSASVLCSKKGSPLANVNQSTYGSGVYANAYSSTQNTITKPTIDLNWYTNAAPGPNHGCNNSPTVPANVSTYPSANASGTPPWTQATFVHTLFDNDTTRNSSLPASQGLSAGKIDPFELVNNSGSGELQNSFDCRYYDASGNLLGRLAFAYPVGGISSSNPGTLTISGTVFIDGSLSFRGPDYVIYQGIGTIYVNGTVTFGNGSKVCAKPISGSACIGNFDQTQNLLEIVAVNAANASPGWTMSGAGTYEGIAFVNGVFSGGNGAQMNGPIIADTALMSGAMNLQSTFTPPPGAPGASVTSTSTVTGPDVVTVARNPGSWQQLG